MTSPYWAVAQVAQPLLVDTLLTREGFEVYRPKIRIKRRAAPLFPGYIMVRIVVRWYPVRWCPGVVRLLMNGETPAKLADSIVAELRAREHRGFVKLLKEPGAIEPGARVRITMAGNFEGRVGIYQGMSGPQRERVLLEWLGQSVPVILPAGNVEMVAQ